MKRQVPLTFHVRSLPIIPNTGLTKTSDLDFSAFLDYNLDKTVEISSRANTLSSANIHPNRLQEKTQLFRSSQGAKRSNKSKTKAGSHTCCPD
eukprot:c724_g1_i1 orf=9-287(-)